MKTALLTGLSAVAVGPGWPAIFGVYAMADDARLKALKGELQQLTEQRDGIVEAADAAEVDLTADELEEVKALNGKITAMAAQIEARESVVASRTGAGRRTAPEPTVNANGDRTVQSVQPRVNARHHGFKHFGDFAKAVRVGSRPGAQVDQRLMAAATTYGNEGTGADGGFLVPPDFRTEIWRKVMDEDSLLSRVDKLVTERNAVTIPKDETTPWQNSGGVQAYWEGEGAPIPESKPSLGDETVRLNKLTALVKVTDEVLEDAPLLGSYLQSKAPSKMNAKINTAIVRGTGAGMPLGILGAGSLITVAKEAGPQTADTIYAVNVSKMWSRLYAPCRRNAIWLINQDCEPQLDLMAFVPGAASPVPVYLPPGGLSAAPYGSLKGRPVVPIEACSALGDLGDIILVDLLQYMGVTKGTDIKSDVSMHLHFDQSITSFRFIFRIAGQPYWGDSITPQFGSNTRSWAVTLEAR